MTNNNMENFVRDFVNKIDKSELEKDALFGVCQYGGGPDESYIYSNKNGLLRFSIELLNSYLNADEIINDKEKTIISIEADEPWIYEKSDTLIDYIEPTAKRREEIQNDPENREESLKEKIIGPLIGFSLLAFIGFGIFGIIMFIRILF